MPRKVFKTYLDDQGDRLSGFASNGTIDPGGIADEIFGTEIPGPWLCCYMLRRFGWPNAGSDPYKNLMSWNLTTPIKGFYLCVTPYMGGSNLHFAVRCTKDVLKQLSADPGRESYIARKSKAITNWWNTKGRYLYQLGQGKVEGDEDTLVYAAGDPEDGMVWGAWKLADGRKIDQRGNAIGRKNQWEMMWWLSELIKEHHPEVRLPKMNKREIAWRETKFQKKVKVAIRATLLDLLKPTYVRDVTFNIFGRDGTPESLKKLAADSVEYFEGAGNTPAYWYSPAGQRERRKKAKGK
jgi:hypothetical protein